MPNQTVRRPPFRTRGQARGFLYSTPAPAPEPEPDPQVPSDVVVLWDFDNDGDFDEPEEDITDFVLQLDTFTGRDWPSLLTGKASPGRLRATLRNDDDRFSFFNTSSPLNQSGNTLRTGRRLRVQTSTAGNPDPALLARDRFNRADGSLGDAETGQTWSQPLSDDFTIAGKRAEATGEGAEHIALLDVGAADYYAQVRLAAVGTTGLSSASIDKNRIGLVYRYQDSSNYSLAVLDLQTIFGRLRLIDVVAGTPTTIADQAADKHDDMTIGVLVDGSTVTLYLEGVPLVSDTAIQTDETQVGIYAEWGDANVTTALDDFHVWDGLPTEVDGILWTGDVSDVFPAVAPGPRKLATMEGRGWLARPAGQTITPPRTVQGRKTGHLIGETLAAARLLHPPGQIDEGDITTGPFGMRDAQAIEVARRFEETEFGFLYESQEGYIRFDSRTARSGAASQATFSDAPSADFDYHGIVLQDWTREVFNRVTAGVTRTVPTLAGQSTHTQSTFDDSNPLTITMQAVVNAGELLVVIAVAIGAGNGNFDTLQWIAPDGWREILASGERSADGRRVFAKIAKGNEGSSALTFATDSSTTSPGCAVARTLRFQDWYGDLAGVSVLSGISSTASPELAFPLPWGREPARFVTARPAYNNAGSAFSDITTAARGYTSLISTTEASSASKHTALATCHKSDVTSIEVANWRAAGDSTERYSGTFDADSVLIVAVRGFRGDPPGSGVSVTLNDVDSQDARGSIRTHRLPSNLFGDTSDATAYAQLVLNTFAEDRPILKLEFTATISAAFRLQAIRRRVGDKITVVANNQAGLGISQDCFIEAISHRIDHGNTLWVVTWELSPA